MGDKSLIEWTDATWNPVTGCTKVSQGCKNCYAERVFPRAYGKERQFTDVQCHPERLDQPLRWKKSRRIFVNSMSDLFHEAVPDEFILKVFTVMWQPAACHHTFQILTKRPKRMLNFLTTKGAETWWGGCSSLWKYVHLGVSCEDQATANERIPLLLATPAAVRFVSLEPLLGPIDLQKPGPWSTWLQPCGYYCDHDIDGGGHRPNRSLIDWVIVGGESGPNARPMHPDWVRALRDQCVATGVPFFFKQWGEWVPKQFYAEAHKGLNYEWGVLDYRGNWFNKATPWNGHEGKDSDELEYTMIRIGKKKAGAVIDGKEWREFPKTIGTAGTSGTIGTSPEA